MRRRTFSIISILILLFGLALSVGAEPPEAASDKQATPEQRSQSQNNLKQIGLAILNDESANKRLTRRAVFDSDGKPLLSWRVHILPYLEGYSLYKEFHLDEPWDSEHNKTLLERMPDVFKDPQIDTDAGMTVYQAVVGPGMAFEGDKEFGLMDIKDGTSKTVAVVETAADKAVPWTKPEDWEIDANDPLKGIADVQPEGYFLVLYLDGHVEAIKHEIEPALMKKICTRNGREPYDSGELPRP